MQLVIFLTMWEEECKKIIFKMYVIIFHPFLCLCIVILLLVDLEKKLLSCSGILSTKSSFSSTLLYLNSEYQYI